MQHANCAKTETRPRGMCLAPCWGAPAQSCTLWRCAADTITRCGSTRLLSKTHVRQPSASVRRPCRAHWHTCTEEANRAKASTHSRTHASLRARDAWWRLPAAGSERRGTRWSFCWCACHRRPHRHHLLRMQMSVSSCGEGSRDQERCSGLAREHAGAFRGHGRP